jgi:hypothetical protein
MAMTRYLRKKLGDHAIGKASFTMPTTVFAALFTDDPTDAGTQTSEISGTGYARQDVTSKISAFDATTGIATSSADIDFGSPGSDWGTGAYIGIMDALTSGNMLYVEALPNPRSMTSGARPVKFLAGQLTIQHI